MTEQTQTAAETASQNAVIEASIPNQVDASAEVSTPPSREALESKVAEGLAKVFGDEPDAKAEGEITDETAQPAEALAESEKLAAEAGKESQEEDKEAVAPAVVAKPAAKPGAPTLPAAIVRSLKSYEWTDEEIADAAKQPNFLATATKIHANRTAEIAKWSEIGRQQKAIIAQQQTANPQTQVADVLQNIPAVDAAKLKATYGDDKLIDSIVGPVNASIAAINAILPVIQQTQTRSQQAELETLSRQVDGFFGGEELKPYTEMYGAAQGALTGEQVAARNKVLETADALMVGARLQGRQFSLGEALTLAHDSVSGGFKTQAVRTALTTQIKTRGKALSLRPTSRTAQTPSTSTGPKTRQELEAATRQRLATAFAR